MNYFDVTTLNLGYCAHNFLNQHSKPEISRFCFKDARHILQILKIITILAAKVYEQVKYLTTSHAG